MQQRITIRIESGKLVFKPTDTVVPIKAEITLENYKRLMRYADRFTSLGAALDSLIVKGIPKEEELSDNTGKSQ